MLKSAIEKWRTARSSTRYVIIVVVSLSLIALLIVAIVLGKAAGRETVYHPDSVFKNPRLPKSIVPAKYNISLQIDMTKKTFWGKETIDIAVREMTSIFVLHANGLNITELDMHRISPDKSPKRIKIARHHTWSKNMYHVIYLKEYIMEGHYQLKVEWAGELKVKLQGLYLSEYVEDGENKTMMASQMQATSAREAIPCFDEPEYKAIFHMKIITEASYSLVLWNTNNKTYEEYMNPRDEEDTRKWQVLTFEPSPHMSPYLLAFIIANFECVEEVFKSELGDKKDITARVCGRPGPIANGDGKYALSKTKEVLLYFEQYYNQSYPLPKCDCVAVPDFQAGAMENWGLVIFRENFVLYNPTDNAVSVKGSVNLVIAHELAHMWFGNLVTMKWWNDVWLNEGFATYVQGLGSSNSEPTWKYKDFLIKETRRVAMARDSRSTSRPASVNLTDTNEIHGLFDAIAYQKGASLLTQLNMIMGEPQFQAGIRAYLARYKFKNANQSQLYTELGKNFTHADFNIEDIMNTWTLQMNFPRVAVRKYSAGKLIMTQNRFLIPDGTIGGKSAPYNYQWFIPIKYRSSVTEASDLKWLLPNQQLAVDYTEATDSFMFINLDGNGFYVTDYSYDLWKSLAKSATITQLNTRERQVLLYDTYVLKNAGYYLIDRQLDLLNICSDIHEDFHTMREVYTQVGEISRNVRSDEVLSGKWQAVWKEKSDQLYKAEAGKKSSTGYVDQLSYIHAMRVCLNYNAEATVDCTTEAKRLWKAYNDDATPIDANVRGLVQSYIVRDKVDDEDDWDKFWDTFIDPETSQAEQDVLLTVLAQTTDKTIIKKYIGYCMDADKIRKSMGLRTMGRRIPTASATAAEVSLDYMLENWPLIAKTFETLDLERPIYIMSVISQQATQEDYDKIEQRFVTGEDAYFNFNGGQYSDVKQGYDRGMQQVLANIQWLATNKDLLEVFLDDNDTD